MRILQHEVMDAAAVDTHQLSRQLSDSGIGAFALAVTPASELTAGTIAWVVLLAAAGSAVGGGVRTLVTLYTSPWVCSCASKTTLFPAATFLVNIGGSLLLGMLSRLSQRLAWDPRLLASLGAGFCGGLTTMSTFALDTVQLLVSGSVGVAALYVCCTVIGCILSTFIGWSVAGAGAASGLVGE